MSQPLRVARLPPSTDVPAAAWREVTARTLTLRATQAAEAPAAIVEAARQSMSRAVFAWSMVKP